MANVQSKKAEVHTTNATSQGGMMMEKIGKFELVTLADAKCDPKIAHSIHRRARDSAKWVDVPGNTESIKIYNEIFNIILKGGKPEEVKAVYKRTVPAGSLSKVGSVMPRDVMKTYRRIDDKADELIYTVRVETKPARYMEKIEWQLANRMIEPAKEDVRPGVIAECCRCGRDMATPEPVLQQVCADCAAEVGKGKSRAGAKRVSTVTIEKEIKKYAAGYLRMKGSDVGEAILKKVNALRSSIGLEAVSPERANAAKNPEDLM
jgi:hypothetical protein